MSSTFLSFSCLAPLPHALAEKLSTHTETLNKGMCPVQYFQVHCWTLIVVNASTAEQWRMDVSSCKATAGSNKSNSNSDPDRGGGLSFCWHPSKIARLMWELSRLRTLSKPFSTPYDEDPLRGTPPFGA